MPVKWFGKEIEARVLAASFEAVDETTAAAAEEASREHWWKNRTSHNLQEQTVNERATLDHGAVSGRFGSTRRRGFYGLFLEIQEPWLRPVADQVFPTLAERLREKLDA